MDENNRKSLLWLHRMAWTLKLYANIIIRGTICLLKWYYGPLVYFYAPNQNKNGKMGNFGNPDFTKICNKSSAVPINDHLLSYLWVFQHSNSFSVYYRPIIIVFTYSYPLNYAKWYPSPSKNWPQIIETFVFGFIKCLEQWNFMSKMFCETLLCLLNTYDDLLRIFMNILNSKSAAWVICEIQIWQKTYVRIIKSVNQFIFVAIKSVYFDSESFSIDIRYANISITNAYRLKILH